MKDDLNGGLAYTLVGLLRNLTSMEDDLNGRQHQWKMTSMEDDLNGRRPQWKTLMKDSMDALQEADDINLFSKL